MIGNLLAIVFIVGSGLLSIWSFQYSVYGFIAVSYGSWILISVVHFRLSRLIGPSLEAMLSPEELTTFRRFNIAIRTPGAGEIFSAYLNLLRLAGFVWGGICIWHELYMEGAIAIAYYFVSGVMIAKLNPFLYFGEARQSGHPELHYELLRIGSIRSKYEVAYGGD